jgi:hypothetical protein
MIKEIAICTVILMWHMYLLVIIVHLVHQDLHSTSLHLPTLHFHLTVSYFTSLSFRLVLLLLNFLPPHYTSLHFTFIRFSPHVYYLHFTPFIIAFLILFLKVLGLHGKVPNTSAASWFQICMVLFTNEYFPMSVLCFLSLIFRTWSTLLR